MRLQKVRWAEALTCFFRAYGTAQLRLRRFCVHHSCLLIAMSISLIMVGLLFLGFDLAFVA